MWGSFVLTLIGIVSMYDPMGSDEKKWERIRRQWHLQQASDVSSGCVEEGKGATGSPLDWEEADREIERQWHQLSSSTWRKRFRAFLLCSWAGDKDGSREAFREVSELFSSLLRGSKLVPSDIAAGLVLLRIREKKERREQRLQEQEEIDGDCIRCIPGIPPPPSGNHHMTKEAPDWMVLDRNVARYLRFSQGAYGWPYLMYLHCVTGLCRLVPYTTCCGCLRRTKPPKVHEDNCCLCGLAALRVISKVPKEDILYVSFQNGYYQAPFVILLDHETKSLVIAVRGSLTIRDIFTDFCAASTEISYPELPPGSAV
ncbi:hypothetical protein J437_LFUL003532, partial [Ladona fulva]